MPALRQGRGASIVNIASDALWLGRPGYLHYVAGKARRVRDDPLHVARNSDPTASG